MKPQRPHRILLVDNYDSFTWNLAHLFGSLGAEVDVVRNDDPKLASDERTAAYDGLCIGPGPGRPEDAGRSLALIAAAAAEGRPLLGVCLGLQAVGRHFGATVDYAPSLMHGKTSRIEHDDTGIFAGLPQGFEATRYHSLCVPAGSLPSDLRVTARSEDGVVQGIVHRTLPIHAVQFHPESVLTPEGASLFRNFLGMLAR